MHIKRFNEGKDSLSQVDFNKEEQPKLFTQIEKIFKGIGFDVSEDGTIDPSNKFAKFICKSGVREGYFEEIDGGKFKLKK